MKTARQSASQDATPLYALKTGLGYVGLRFQDQELVRVHLWKPAIEALYEEAFGRPYPADRSPLNDEIVLVTAPNGPVRESTHPPIRRSIEMIYRYLNGEEVDLTAIPCRVTGVTEFQKRILAACREVPYGQRCSYGDLAERVGSPKAARAVGQAMSRNPIPIVVPCHRVVGSSGALTGYSGGLQFKRTLLDMETSHPGARS